MTTFSKSEKDDRTVDAGVRTRARTLHEQVSSPGGFVRISLLKRKLKKGQTSKSHKSKNEKSQGFLMTPPIE